jgi:hypothetical protein
LSKSTISEKCIVKTKTNRTLKKQVANKKRKEFHKTKRALERW